MLSLVGGPYVYCCNAYYALGTLKTNKQTKKGTLWTPSDTEHNLQETMALKSQAHMLGGGGSKASENLLLNGKARRYALG